MSDKMKAAIAFAKQRALENGIHSDPERGLVIAGHFQTLADAADLLLCPKCGGSGVVCVLFDGVDYCDDCRSKRKELGL